MGEHEPSIGESSEWYTPKEIFDGLDCVFDLDPFAPLPQHREHYSVPAKERYTIVDDGMEQDWAGRFVWVNPPYGGRNGHVPALLKYLSNGNGIGCFRSYTSADWFHRHAIKADCMLFPRGKTKFVRPDGSIGKAPGSGVVLLGCGARAMHAMQHSGLGWFVLNSFKG